MNFRVSLTMEIYSFLRRLTMPLKKSAPDIKPWIEFMIVKTYSMERDEAPSSPLLSPMERAISAMNSGTMKSMSSLSLMLPKYRNRIRFDISGWLKR